ncbi:NDP-hexose 2,3-dehydratase family protein (plasmid) [Streptomyces sp. NBC_00390]|uniref:NDP-hexose 2,3-dehydratase family protein n=1 Tax=Streptomyces sp. NBC_00390 TaxID=2975736 RepID=UPI002E203D8C
MFQALVSPPRSEGTTDDLDRRRFVESAAVTEGQSLSTKAFWEWFDLRRAAVQMDVRLIPLAGLRQWGFQPGTGNLVHESGRFFSVEGLRTRLGGAEPRGWDQPIIHQPEIGFLGILVKEIDGVLHCLMQAKAEPGNAKGLQLSPTVQATRSNYTGVHRGSAVRYLEYFSGPKQGRVLVDVLQSEHGSWFYRKRNRNMVVEVTDDVPQHEDYCWLTLGQVRRLLQEEDLVNMDTRTVLACIPLDEAADVIDVGDDPFRAGLAASLSPQAPSAHTLPELLRWYTAIKTGTELSTERIPLDAISGWATEPDGIRHDSGRDFSVVAVSVEAGNREVRRWTQPLLRTCAEGVIAFLARRIGSVVHVLVRAGVEPGCRDAVELGPTVQFLPGSDGSPLTAERPPFLDEVLAATPEQIRYDVTQSEEGGRFYRVLSRYMVVEIEHDVSLPDGYRWMTVGQLGTLLQHSHYINIQARSLIACLQSVW